MHVQIIRLVLFYALKFYESIKTIFSVTEADDINVH